MQNISDLFITIKYYIFVITFVFRVFKALKYDFWRENNNVA